MFPILCTKYKINPNPRKIILLWEKVASNATLNLLFLGLGWPWVGEVVVLIMIFICFPTRHNLESRKHAHEGCSWDCAEQFATSSFSGGVQNSPLCSDTNFKEVQQQCSSSTVVVVLMCTTSTTPIFRGMTRGEVVPFVLIRFSGCRRPSICRGRPSLVAWDQGAWWALPAANYIHTQVQFGGLRSG